MCHVDHNDTAGLRESIDHGFNIGCFGIDMTSLGIALDALEGLLRMNDYEWRP